MSTEVLGWAKEALANSLPVEEVTVIALVAIAEQIGRLAEAIEDLPRPVSSRVKKGRS